MISEISRCNPRDAGDIFLPLLVKVSRALFEFVQLPSDSRRFVRVAARLRHFLLLEEIRLRHRVVEGILAEAAFLLHDLNVSIKV